MRFMSRLFSVVLIALLLESGAQAQVYQTIDEQGNPVFSDTPSVGSDEVELPAANIADVPPPSAYPAEESTKSQAEHGAHQHRTEKYQTGQKITRDGALKIMGECENQREENIAPLRDQAIEDCVNKGGDRGYCERYNKTFGDPTRQGRVLIPGMFWDLPVCEKAVAAENYFKSNPHSRTYSLP